MTAEQDPNSDEARLQRHRDLHRTVSPEVAATWQREADTQALLIQQRAQAIQHLQALLNTDRTAMEALQAEELARDWLKSIGSEPGATDPITSYYTDRANGVHAAKAP